MWSTKLCQVESNEKKRLRFRHFCHRGIRALLLRLLPREVELLLQQVNPRFAWMRKSNSCFKSASMTGTLFSVRGTLFSVRKQGTTPRLDGLRLRKLNFFDSCACRLQMKCSTRRARYSTRVHALQTPIESGAVHNRKNTKTINSENEPCYLSLLLGRYQTPSCA